MSAYGTDPVQTYEVAKPGGGVRRMARLSARDAETWDALGAIAAPLIERRMDRRVLANRAARRGWSWRPAAAGPALERARIARRRYARERETLATDLRSFYASVCPGVLHTALVRIGAGRPSADLAASMVEGWGIGLPIGPDGSAILANAVLIPVDEALGATPFLRWVDDYLLPASFPLERLDESLAAVGLQRSLEKTAPLDPDDPWPSRSGRRYG